MRLLLAEDEGQLARAVATVLEHTGYEVDRAENGSEAVKLAQTHSYDCMILDIMMPVMDGIEALTRIRAGGDVTPVILLTAKAEVEDRISGLDAGADDYLTKPFAMGELVARIRSATRRKSAYTPRIFKMGRLVLDKDRQELRAENSIRLSGRENELMEYLLLNRDKDLTRDEVFRRVWPENPEEGEEIVWVYVSYLKAKLQAVSADVEITGSRQGPYRIRKTAS
jgi:DNA-binding response OmpR family regulator